LQKRLLMPVPDPKQRTQTPLLAVGIFKNHNS